MTEPLSGSTLEELRERFESVLQPGPKGYFSGGAGDELTLAANCAAWRDWQIHPRVLVDVSDRDSSVELLGRVRPHPLIAAPTAYHRLAHPRGEPETARGCESAGAIYTLSTLATARPAEVAAAAKDGTNWFQVYVFKDRGVTADLVAEAVDCGFEALVVTADLPVLGARDRDRRNGFTIGDADLVPGVSAAGASGLISMQDTADLIDPSLTWTDIERLAGESPLPVLVKGVLRPDDALLAVASGAAGVVVSNHGGRQLDTVPATASVLSGVVEALDGSGSVIVDGGIRRGTDVLIALTLGADAVMLGRPVLWGLAAAGAAGVEAAFAAVLDEFDRALALSGCPRAAELRGRSDLVVPKAPRSV